MSLGLAFDLPEREGVLGLAFDPPERERVFLGLCLRERVSLGLRLIRQREHVLLDSCGLVP